MVTKNCGPLVRRVRLVGKLTHRWRSRETNVPSEYGDFDVRHADTLVFEDKARIALRRIFEGGATAVSGEPARSPALSPRRRRSSSTTEATLDDGAL